MFSESSAQAKHSFGDGAKQNYWAKGTGFGTGSTASSWNIEKAMSDKIKEEEELVIIFQVCVYSNVLVFEQQRRNSDEVIYSHPFYIMVAF